MKLLLKIVVIVLFLSGCADGEKAVSPEARAGEWRGSAKCGNLSFVVNLDGKTISSVEFSKLRGENTKNSYSLENKSGGWLIADDGKFDINTMKLLDNIIFYGKFNRGATRATGTWRMPSGWSSKWKATKGK